MNALKQLKKKIYEDGNIERLLEELECEAINSEQGGELITAQLPERFNSNNRRSVQIRNNTSLSGHIRSRGVTGDLLTVVSYIKYDARTKEEEYESLFQVKNWILNTLDYQDIKTERKKSNVNGWLYDIKKKRNKRLDSFESDENEIIDESVLNKYYFFSSYDWIKEGIDHETQFKFGVRLSVDDNRIVFPIHNLNGKLIGVKGRTLDKKYKDKQIPKYLYLYRLNKSIELYNYHRAYEKIQERKQVFVFESEKSVMFADQFGYEESLACSGDELSPYQIKLLKGLGIDIDIIIAFDKDKDKKHLVNQIKQIKNRRVFIIYDNSNMLEGKESPVDRGKKVFDELVENKLRYKG